ncbi:MAG: LysM domain-containing protein [Pseudomonadales bacterium]|nr:LysM domain-containing protein [Pseudomonadales bacterium]
MPLLFVEQPVAAAGDVVTLREDSPSAYVVVRGDTLWDIAGRFLEEPWRWPEVWRLNPQIENPDLIYPGDTVELSYVEGAPVLTLRRAAAPALETVKLSPQVRREVLRSPIPSISLDAIDAHLTGNRALSREQIQVAPRLLETRSGRLLAASGEEVFGRGEWLAAVSSYDIMRPGAEIEDPVTGAGIGIEATLIGRATVLNLNGDLGTLRVDGVEQEVRLGDIFVPKATNTMDSSYFPEAPNFPVEARIVRIGSGRSAGGPQDTVLLNIGERDDIRVGHLLAIQKPDRIVRDEKAGEELVFSGKKFAQVLIYSVSEQSSQGLVLSADDAIRLDDRIVTP